MYAQIMQAVKNPVRAVPKKQRNDDKQETLAGPVLRESQYSRIAERVARKHDVQRRRDTGDEYQHRADQCRQHAAGTEQCPEYRCVRALHVAIHLAMAKTAMLETIAAPSPARMMALAETRTLLRKIGGSVRGMMLNQVQV